LPGLLLTPSAEVICGSGHARPPQGRAAMQQIADWLEKLGMSEHVEALRLEIWFEREIRRVRDDP
jgi:hypothetical protein